MSRENLSTETILSEQIDRRFRRSEFVEEIVSDKPGFILSYGTMFFFFILVLLGLICWFIKYPDLVNTKARLTSINAPKGVITKQPGKLIKLFVTENHWVKKGEVLAYLESTASHDEIISLSAYADTIQILLQNNEMGKLPFFFSKGYQNLGELQQGYQTFQQAFQLFSNYLNGGFYLRKKTMLLKDVTFMQRLHSNLSVQKELNTADLALTQQTFAANESLKADKVISEFDYRNEKSKLIGKKLTLPQINAAIINNQSQQHEKKKEIAELENTIAQQKNIFAQALNTLKSQIDDWKKIYLLTAPVDGKISFATFLQENQQLQGSQTICFVNPGNTEYYAEVYIPQANFGKIKMGQQVLLKFPAYPFQEYGSIIGRLDFISNITTDSGYLAKVILPNGLNTSYKKQIQFREGLQAQGEIIAANMRLLQRFYYSIVKQVEK